MDIYETIAILKKNWYRNRVSKKDIKFLTESFQKIFPQDYLLFLKELGGGSYIFKDLLFSFWGVEEIVELNQEYQINKYLGKELIGIATDGGEICFLLDFRVRGKVKFASCSLGDLDIDEVKILADSFTEALQLMLEEKITLDDII